MLVFFVLGTDTSQKEKIVAKAWKSFPIFAQFYEIANESPIVCPLRYRPILPNGGRQHVEGA